MCFSGTLLLFPSSNGYWQFDLWFFWLFSFQLEHLEVHGSCSVEAWLGEFEHYFASMWDECSSVVVWTFFSYYSWGSQGKNTEVVCHSLLQWTTFCQTSSPWPAHLGWPHRAWFSFIELDQAVVCVIAFLRDWNENSPFPVLWPLLSFPDLLAYWVLHFLSVIF